MVPHIPSTFRFTKYGKYNTKCRKSMVTFNRKLQNSMVESMKLTSDVVTEENLYERIGLILVITKLLDE